MSRRTLSWVEEVVEGVDDFTSKRAVLDQFFEQYGPRGQLVRLSDIFGLYHDDYDKLYQILCWAMMSGGDDVVQLKQVAAQYRRTAMLSRFWFRRFLKQLYKQSELDVRMVSRWRHRLNRAGVTWRAPK
jgi:hypothetical protein